MTTSSYPRERTGHEKNHNDIGTFSSNARIDTFVEDIRSSGTW